MGDWLLTIAKKRRKMFQTDQSVLWEGVSNMDKTLKKDLIADAALSCFLSSGYSCTSVDEIVKASGTSKGGIYWHFKSKDEIFLYIIDKRFNEWDQEFAARLNADGSAKEELSKFVDFFLEIIFAPVLALMHEFILQAKDEEVLKRVHDFSKTSNRSDIIKKIIQKSIANGEFRSIDPEAAANVFIGIFEGIGLQWFTQHKDQRALERTAKTALDIFWKGMSIK